MVEAKKSFSAVLQDLDDGELLTKLTGELAAVVQGVRRTEEKGKLVLELQVSTDGGIILIQPKVKTTIPVAPMKAVAFMMNFDGSLARQLDLNLGPVIKLSNMS